VTHLRSALRRDDRVSRKECEHPKPLIVYCSMAKHSWLQPAGEINNPYYADGAIRECGELRSE
jgi:hypothetical protein